MSIQRMTTADIAKPKLAIVILLFLVLGIPCGLFNSWLAGHFPEIRLEAEQKIAELQKTEPSTLSQKARKSFDKWALNQQLRSASPLAFGGWTMFAFFVLYACIARLLFKKKGRECKFSFVLSIIITITIVLSTLFFSAIFHFNKYSNMNNEVTLLSALNLYSSFWLMWLLVAAILFAILTTKALD
jgi:hypothetical protein